MPPSTAPPPGNVNLVLRGGGAKGVGLDTTDVAIDQTTGECLDQRGGQAALASFDQPPAAT
ncbi:MAG TPA: hypothetical protein VK277_06545 [Acidimicrobiales bacterium]|nr:hypothetical protein [Acidimicrobiales bacterium]